MTTTQNTDLPVLLSTFCLVFKSLIHPDFKILKHLLDLTILVLWFIYYFHSILETGGVH